ncbi:MAG: phenylalanine--tRNA ligase subunit beta, partial [Candidatus Aegiribacteria sp.]|nr:phenylalanine--tRNA ligase subunit beta [Candidatus Aegiribacteria sp.]
ERQWYVPKSSSREGGTPMPKIEVGRRDLFSLAGTGEMSNDELEDVLSVVKGELDDSFEDRLKIELNDTNRPDLWCVEGVARALRCYRQGPEEHLADLPEPGGRVIVDEGLKNIRPFVAAFTACGWAPGEDDLEALIEVQEKLASSFGKDRKDAGAGFYRLDDIVFPVRYRAAHRSTSFVPLGEEREMTLAETLELTETGRKYAHILEGCERMPVLQDEDDKVLSFPPILNSQTTGRVQAGDSRLFCEVTGTRWETVQLMATILACNLEDRGAEITPLHVVYSGEDSFRTGDCPVRFDDTLTASLDEIERITGAPLTAGQVSEALSKMDYDSVEIEGSSVRGVLPPYRRDGIHSVDMVEDIIISMGLSSFEPLLPERFTIGRSSETQELADSLRLLMTGAGCEEIVRPVLTSREKVMDLTASREEPVALANPMTAEYGVVRNTLLPGLLEVESTSAHAAYPHRVFEAGEVLGSEDGVCSTGILLACLVCGNEADLGDVHSVLGALCHARGAALELKPSSDSRFVPGRSAEVIIGGTPSGVIGEIHPAVLERWGITRPAAAFEVDLVSLKG